MEGFPLTTIRFALVAFAAEPEAGVSAMPGKDVKTALVHAVQTRFRPILMTTLAMVFGMMPIALATGAGAEWKNGLAWVLIGGLTSSMFLTLLVVPVIYYLFDRIMERFGWNKKTVIELNDDELHNSEVMEALKKKKETRTNGVAGREVSGDPAIA